MHYRWGGEGSQCGEPCKHFQLLAWTEGALHSGSKLVPEQGIATQVVVVSEVNMGIMEAWRNAWSWKERELFIVIEDDVEMSPQWYKALLG